MARGCVLGYIQYGVLRIVYDQLFINDNDAWIGYIAHILCENVLNSKMAISDCSRNYHVLIKRVLNVLVNANIIKRKKLGRLIIYVKNDNTNINSFSDFVVRYIDAVNERYVKKRKS